MNVCKGLVVERAQFFRARAELKFWVSSPDKLKPDKISRKPALSPTFLLVKMQKLRARAYFKSFWKLGSSSHKHGDY